MLSQSKNIVTCQNSNLYIKVVSEVDPRSMMKMLTSSKHDSYFPDLEAAWWMVDMTSSVCVGKVTIYNRADCCSK